MRPVRIALSVLNRLKRLRAVSINTQIYTGYLNNMSRFRMDNTTRLLGLSIARHHTSFLAFALSVPNLFSVEGLGLSIHEFIRDN